ncbi:hypothetical protein LTR36_003184 [Oleoguttula mirabilis]|uniref:Uncharacterized protein n=1 Tax=Oleoguttula mirabilis TaxID=1507867 RepID=A0AAV9JWU0_9PEZI|nr:hypothetical protein LTR36_003184 [Oleoguttula mirabilis]
MDKSPLGGLPPELRNRIYELVLQQKTSPHMAWMSTDGKKVILSPDKGKAQLVWIVPPSHSALALTETCHQIRAECSKLFYAVNNFTVDCELASLMNAACGLPMDKLLEFIPVDNAAVMKSLVLDIGTTHVYNLRWLGPLMGKLTQWLEAVGRVPLQLRMRCRLLPCHSAPVPVAVNPNNTFNWDSVLVTSIARASSDGYPSIPFDFDLNDLQTSYRNAAATLEMHIARSKTDRAREEDLEGGVLECAAGHIRRACITAGFVKDDA